MKNKGKVAGVDNIPAELVQEGGETMISALLTICNKIWQTGGMANTMDSVTHSNSPEFFFQECQNYHTISFICHPRKVMLKIILNRLKPQAEEIIAEEQAGFRPGLITTEQIFNLRILCEKIPPAPTRPLSCLYRF